MSLRLSGESQSHVSSVLELPLVERGVLGKRVEGRSEDGVVERVVLGNWFDANSDDCTIGEPGAETNLLTSQSAKLRVNDVSLPLVFLSSRCPFNSAVISLSELQAWPLGLDLSLTILTHVSSDGKFVL
jgi:hypothetical protein